MRDKKKAFLLNLQPDLFDQVCNMASVLGKTKTSFIEQSIVRNLDFVRRHELPVLRRLDDQYASRRTGEWMVQE